MKKRFIISTALIGTLFFGSIAFAGYGGYGKGQRMMTDEQYQQVLDERLARMDVILELDEGQQAQIKDLLSQHWQNRQADRERMRAGRDTRMAAMVNGEFDEATLRSNMAKRAEYQADRTVAQAKIKAEVYAILTPEQQDKADKLLAANSHRGRGRHAMGFGF
jgi:Spy/CpxP family protein refolding chaperone